MFNYDQLYKAAYIGYYLNKNRLQIIELLNIQISNKKFSTCILTIQNHIYKCNSRFDFGNRPNTSGVKPFHLEIQGTI